MKKIFTSLLPIIALAVLISLDSTTSYAQERRGRSSCQSECGSLTKYWGNSSECYLWPSGLKGRSLESLAPADQVENWRK